MATPGRTTRSRSRQTTPQPLPAVDTRHSNAYGSRGRAHLHNQIAEEGITLAEGFTTARAGAAIAPVLEESEEDDQELHTQPSLSRQGTYVGSYAHYESPIHSQRHESMPPPSPRRAAPDITEDVPSTPWTLSVLLFAVPRYIWRNLWALLIGALLLGTIANVPLPENAAARRDTFFSGIKMAVGVPGYEQPPAYLEKLWMFVRYKAFLAEELEEMAPIREPILQSMVNVRLRTLISELEGNFTSLEGNHTALAQRVSTMEEFLPPRMVVDLVDGHMVISDDFWEALNEKMDGSDDLFNAFVAANEESATKIAQAVADVGLDEALRSKRVLDRDSMMEVFSQHSVELEKRLVSMVQAQSAEAMSATRILAAQVAKEVSESIPSDLRTQLGVLAKSNILYNTYQAMNSVNWFSPKMGAVVDPHHSSPTAKKPYEIPSGGWFAKSIKRVAAPPIAALMPWEETGDCWCAAKNERMGQAQLAVMTERKIRPDRLIIEHIPRGGQLDKYCAPEKFQLWAEVSDAQEAEALGDKISSYEVGHWGTPIKCSKSETPPPSENSICIAEGSYDLKAENWVQSFKMRFHTDSHYDDEILESGKFYFRVLNNYGSAQTCIYRIRLTAHTFDTEEAMSEESRREREREP